MKLLNHLLPRDIDTTCKTEGVTLLHSLFTGTHLERRMARAIGWRGFLPSNTGNFSWTARLANSDWVYGIVFRSEENDEHILSSNFVLYAFPIEPELFPLLPQNMRSIAESPDYLNTIRNLSHSFEQLEVFRLGNMTLLSRIDKEGLSLFFETFKRHPFSAAKALRPIRILLPLFSALAKSLEMTFQEKASVRFLKNSASGNRAVSMFEASFGRPVFEDNEEAVFSVNYLPLSYQPDEIDSAEKPLIHVLCGFLGSGKTTFLQNWLNFLHTRERFTGVIQNEFGEIDLDTALIGSETQVESLNDGCICCSLADSLRPGLLRLMKNTPAEQFILETTGVANPDNVVHSLEELSDIINIGLVISVVDTLNMSRHPDYLEEKLRKAQISRADVIVLSKAELIPRETLHALADQLQALNPKALLLVSENGNANFAVLDYFFNRWLDKHYGVFTSRNHAPGQDSMLLTNEGFRLGRRDKNLSVFETCALKFKQPLNLDEVADIIQQSGDHILRAKGLVKILGKGRCEVQFTDGVLTISKASNDLQLEEDWLTIIGRGLKPQENSTEIRKEICL